VPSMSSWVRPKNCILSCRPLNAISTTVHALSRIRQYVPVAEAQ
jgi:hypothetical protein